MSTETMLTIEPLSGRRKALPVVVAVRAAAAAGAVTRILPLGIPVGGALGVSVVLLIRLEPLVAVMVLVPIRATLEALHDKVLFSAGHVNLSPPTAIEVAFLAG